ncbi:MAG: potassium channel protein [Planctomycetia bacterium]|nr:potassium channel protein [Planctomycetia bacterium]
MSSPADALFTPTVSSDAMASPLRRVTTGLLMLAGIVTIAVTGYVLAGWPVVDAVYMVVITIFGVGYGEVHPLDKPWLKVFTIGVIIAGCSAGLWVVGGLVEIMAEGRIREALGKHRMNQLIDELRGHAIVCGFGRVGQILCRDLTAAGMPLVVIDADAGRLTLAESQGYPVVMGDAAEEQTLRRAHIDTARVVAVVLPDDAANVFVTLSARELSGTVEIIARGERPDTERKLLRSGATRVVLPAAAGANRIARMITHPSAETLLGDADSMGQLNEQLLDIGMEIGQITIQPESELAGSTLADVDLRQSAVVIVAIRKADGEIRRSPHPTSVLEPLDTLIVVGRHDDLPRSLLRLPIPAQLTFRGATAPRSGHQQG